MKIVPGKDQAAINEGIPYAFHIYTQTPCPVGVYHTPAWAGQASEAKTWTLNHKPEGQVGMHKLVSMQPNAE